VADKRPETATVLFTDLVGSTAWRAATGDAPADTRMAELERVSREVVAAEGGSVVKSLGDGVMATFVSAVAALDAAAGLQAVAHRLTPAGEGMQLRVGVSSGDMVREGEDWYGTAAIEASRLCTEAAGGTVLVGAATVHLARGRVAFGLRSLGERRLRGFAAAIEVFELVWRTDDRQVPPALSTVATATLVGRTAEIGLGRAMLDSVAAGASRSLLVVGEAGVGKTAVVGAIAQIASTMDFTVVYGHCDEGLRAPYQPVVEALGMWLADCPDVALARVLGPGGPELVRLWPDLARRLPSLAAATTDEPEVQRWRLFEAVAGLARTIAAARPLLVVVDDLQWAEPATLLLLGHMIKAAGAHTALTMTIRSGETEGDPSSLLGEIGSAHSMDVFALDGLDGEEIAELVALHAGDRPPDELTHQLKQQTDGNPFFLGALLAHLDDVALLRRGDGGWVTTAQLDEVGVPEGVRAVIDRRLERLDAPVRRALEVAAVVGQAFAESIIRSVLDLAADHVVEALDEACTAGLLREQEAGRLVFAHALVRHAVLDHLSQTRLARLHWRIAEALERLPADGSSRSGEIAYHYAAGLQVGDATTVVRTALAAGDDAVERVAYEDAAHHFRVALDSLGRVPPDPELRYQVLASYAEALNTLADPDAAGPLWLEAADIARRAGDPERLFHAVRGYSSMFRIVSDPGLPRLLDDVLDLLPPGDSALRARALAWKADPSSGYEDRDRRRIEDALAMARRIGDPATISIALNATMWVKSSVPDGQAVLRATEELYEIYRASDEATRARADLLLGLARALLRVGRRAEAEERLAEYRERAADRGSPAAVSNALRLEAAIALADGRFAESKRLAAESSHHRGRDKIAQLANAAQILAARMEQGRVGEVIAELRGLVDVLSLPASRAMLAGALADAGDHTQAAAELAELTKDKCWGLPPDFTVALAVRYLPEVCRQLGDVARAEALLPLVTPWAGQLLVFAGGLSIEGASDRSIGHLLATLGRFDEAVTAYTDGARLERANGFRPLAARTSYWHARALLQRDAADDRDNARALLDEVVAVTDELGMRQLADQANALLQTT
jgi:class 3 adenylate cyclase/tetratricopeptide (TPR) repeat protein